VIDVDTAQQSEPNENAYGVMCRVQGTVGQKQAIDPALAAILTDSTAEPTVEAAQASAEALATAEGTAEATQASAATTEATTETALTQPLLTATPPPTLAPVPDGNGYLFLIQGGGQFAIMRATGRNLKPLIDWTASDAIKQGVAENHLRAVCDGTYLAFYINDTFVGDATDDTYNSGQVGLAASSANRAGTRITYDNLTIANALAK
jgi:Ca2+-binding RTX toxin-like protein